MSDRHDRPFFYKYATAATALKVIKSRSFRWSSPTLFNDPFDHQTGFKPPFTAQEYAEACVRGIEEIIYGENEFEPVRLDYISLSLKSFTRLKGKLPREKFRQEIAPAIPEMVGNFPEIFARFNRDIIKHFCDSRVFCVTETNTNIAMWAYYAGNHEGVVFKLNCIPELDNALCIAEKVQYTDRLPDFVSSDKWLRHSFGLEDIDIRHLAWQLVRRKHSDWAHEKEWRVHRPEMGQGDGRLYSEFREHPEVFGEIYLGCRMEESREFEIREALHQMLPHVIVYKAERSKNEFSLEFVRRGDDV